jgi:hypothetical protein
MKTVLICLCAAYAIFSAISSAQPNVAPTDGAVGPPRGYDFGGYNVVNSFETGYRFRSVEGNLGKYRSDVNYGNGMRLLGSRLSIHSKEGHGGYFDELLLNTQGLGNDPYQFSSLRVQKNRLYKYDLLWRQSEYYNPALPLAGGQHFIDTVRRLQDHSLVFLPQSPFRIYVGYSRMWQGGPALSTVQIFDSRGDEFPLAADVRRSQDEYRLGFDLDVSGIKLSVMRGWEFFKDDTRRTASALAGNNPDDRTTLANFRRDEPYHGETETWRVNLLVDKSKLYSVNGRFAWAGGQRNFIVDEITTGTDRIGSARNRQVLVFGDARRPVSSGSLTATFYPTQALTLVNHTSFHHTRMEGDGSYSELSNPGFGFAQLNFNFLGIRTIATSTDVNIRTSEALTLFAGHHYSTRRIRSIEQVTFDGVPERVESETDNSLQAGRAGVRLRAFRRLSLILDAELGRSDRPVYPVSERNYHALSGRVQYRSRTFTASFTTRTNYNTNSVSLFSHSSKSRNYSADASWSPLSWAGLDASYSKLHLDTLSGIAYFRVGALTADRSVYVSNIHAGSITGRFSAGTRVDLFLGYTRVQDTGGKYPGLLFQPVVLEGTPPAPPLPSNGFQVYPLTYQTPLARVSVRLHQRLRLNAGYQHYRYSEDILPTQNYRAHTGFSSLMWSF